MYIKVQVISRKLDLYLISARHKCLRIAARESSEGRSGMQRHVHFYKKRCLQMDNVMQGSIKSVKSCEQITLHSVCSYNKRGSDVHVFIVHTIGSNAWKALHFLDQVAIYKDLFSNKSDTLKVLPIRKSKGLKAYATEGKKHVLGRYHQSSQFLEMPISLSQFRESFLISPVLKHSSYVELGLKINYLQSLGFVVKRFERNNWNWVVTFKRLEEPFTNNRYYLNCNKFVSEILYTWLGDQSYNLHDMVKYKQRGSDKMYVTAMGKEQKTKSLNKWIQRLAIVYTSFAFTRHYGQCEAFYQSSAQHARASYTSGKCCHFDKASNTPFGDFNEKGKDTIFGSYWPQYVHNDQCFVYPVNAQTTNAPKDDASATDSRQGQDQTDVSVTEDNVTEGSHPEPETSGPILESTSTGITLSFQLEVGKNQPECISLSRRPSTSTEEHRGGETPAVESSVDHSANTVVEDETDFGFSLRLNPASASTIDRQCTTSTAGIHTTLHTDDLNIESEHSLGQGLNLWNNAASARNNPSQRTGPSAGVLRAVTLGIENSQGGAFSTSQSVTGDTLNPVLNVSLNDAITLRMAGNADEMQTFTPNDVDVNPPLVRRRDWIGRVLMGPISTSAINAQSRGILNSMILLRQQGDVDEMLNFEDADIFLHPSHEQG